MTDLRTAAQQALEALEIARMNGKAGLYPAEIEEIADTITALNAALAEHDKNLAGFKERKANWDIRAPLSPRDLQCKLAEETQERDRQRREYEEQRLAALAEPVQEPPEFPPHDDKVHAGAIYWYVGTDGKYYSSNEVKLFMEAKNKSLHYEPPKWVLDNFDLIPLYTAPPQRKPLTDDQLDDIAVAARSGNLYDLRIAIERAHETGGSDA